MELLNPSRLASFQSMQKTNWQSQILSHLIKQPLQPTYSEYLSLNDALTKGDDLMEPLMQWMMQNPKLHRTYFETALFHGLDQ